MGLHEWIQGDDVDLARLNDGFEVGDHGTVGKPPALVHRHQLAARGTRGGQEQPALELRSIYLVMQHYRQDATTQLQCIVFERHD